MDNIENDIHPVIKNWDLDEEQEKKEIVRHYRALLKILKSKLKKGDKELLRAAFEMAANAHKTMRRKSGEPYILHPIAVAMICVDEIGLGVRSTICALLHDTVEDTDVTLDDIKSEFGNEIAKIVDGLTKISTVMTTNISQQSENFKKILLTLTDDPRVILIKLADRLHNLRTMYAMKQEKQLKIGFVEILKNITKRVGWCLCNWGFIVWLIEFECRFGCLYPPFKFKSRGCKISIM
jgi:GTP pyrophosphokinase